MISVENLYFAYPRQEEPTLKGLEFSVAPGEIFGFLGPSGAGKSTTQKVLTNLLSGYQGRARIQDREIRDWGRDLYEEVGIGFELPYLYGKLSGLENLELFRSFYKRKGPSPRELLALVGLEDAANQRVEAYSKGMQMRLTLIRALVHDPALLFLDEPTSGLDPGNARRVKDLILEWKARGKTIFLTTHNMAVADELCDRVAFLVEGRFALVDSPRVLKQGRGKAQVQVRWREEGSEKTRDFSLAQAASGDGEYRALVEHPGFLSLHSLEANLEQIFLETTGRGLS